MSSKKSTPFEETIGVSGPQFSVSREWIDSIPDKDVPRILPRVFSALGPRLSMPKERWWAQNGLRLVRRIIERKLKDLDINETAHPFRDEYRESLTTQIAEIDAAIMEAEFGNVFSVRIETTFEKYGICNL